MGDKLKDPSLFFKSRRSVRDFAPRSVDRSLIREAVDLARSTPSACNRQAWHVYVIDDRLTIDKALEFQNGNRGFGHEVPCLLIVAADLRAFSDGMERYQHWIDGGMFGMTLLLAFHALGLNSCCLNWSKGPRGDMYFRNTIPIQPAHSVIMMIAVGYASPVLKVCASRRSEIADIITWLGPETPPTCPDE